MKTLKSTKNELTFNRNIFSRFLEVCSLQHSTTDKLNTSWATCGLQSFLNCFDFIEKIFLSKKNIIFSLFLRQIFTFIIFYSENCWVQISKKLPRIFKNVLDGKSYPLQPTSNKKLYMHELKHFIFTSVCRVHFVFILSGVGNVFIKTPTQGCTTNWN